MPIIDDRTSGLNLPLPNPDNLLGDDVLRLRDALTELDAAIVAVLGGASSPYNSLNGLLTLISSHASNTSNPHSTTKAQVGLGNCDNTSDASKPVSTAQAAADTVVQSAASTDATTKANAAQAYAIQRANHTGTQLAATISDFTSAVNALIPAQAVTSVAGRTGAITLTKSDVGLGSVDNTSDASKPVSTAQATAIAAKINSSLIGAANGVASLDSGGRVPSAQMPTGVAPIAWVTKTANYTAAVGDGILADVSGGSWTLTLPASPNVGDQIPVIDLAGMYSIYPLTFGSNGNKIKGFSEDMTISTSGANLTLIYTGATYGWNWR